MLGKIKSFFMKVTPSKRKLIQLYAALLYNANLKGFITGDIFKGDSKSVCLPGMNCYSCPGAIGACPLGSIQAALAESKTKAPTYVLGIILLYCIIFGRTICGWLCPVGLLQELLYKIRTPKLKKNRVTRLFSYFKYVLLFVLVFALPIIYGIQNLPFPAFCKYVCPAGTFEGAVFLVSNPNNNHFFTMLDVLFTWKFVLMIIFLVGAVFIYRFFCRFFCPLGALYGLFNKLSILGVKVDKSKCNHCQACITNCKMDVKEVGDHECINCGDCRKVCHCNAIEWKTIGKLIKEDEIEEMDAVIASDVDLNVAEAVNTSNEEIKLEEAPKKKKISKSKIIKWTSAIIAVILLVFTIIYANVMNKTERFDYGNKVGDTCVDRSLGIIGSDEEFSVQDNNGKITIINFWYTSCTPCLKELPYFDQIQKAYPEDVTVIAVHEGSSYASNPAYVENFINKKYKNYTLTFVYDDYTDSNASLYYSELGGTGTWPMTVIVDQNGIISLVKYDAATYEQLEAEVERLLANNN